MASAIVATVPGHGAIDVGVNGSLARASGMVAAKIASDRLYMVLAISKTDPIHQTAHQIPVRNSNHQRLPNRTGNVAHGTK